MGRRSRSRSYARRRSRDRGGGRRSRSRDRGRDRDSRRDRERDSRRSRDRRDRDERRERDRERERDSRRDRSRDRNSKRSSTPIGSKRRDLTNFRFDSPPRGEEAEREKQGAIAAMIAMVPTQKHPAQQQLDNHVDKQGQALARKLTQHARQLYIGNLPENVTGQQVGSFVNEMMIALNLTTSPGDPVTGSRLNAMGFCFVEFRTMEETTNGMKLNGADMLGYALKVSRPRHYIESDATNALGQTQRLLALAAGEEIAERLALCHLPNDIDEVKANQLLATFGTLKFFQLYQGYEDKDSAAIFEFELASSQQTARKALSDIKIGSRNLEILQPDVAIQQGCVYLSNIVCDDDLADDREYEEILEDISIECKNFGDVVDIKIPREGDGKGYVFVEMDHIESASKVKKNLSGRKFGGMIVECNFFSETFFKTDMLANPQPNVEVAEQRERTKSEIHLDQHPAAEHLQNSNGANLQEQANNLMQGLMGNNGNNSLMAGLMAGMKGGKGVGKGGKAMGNVGDLLAPGLGNVPPQANTGMQAIQIGRPAVVAAPTWNKKEKRIDPNDGKKKAMPMFIIEYGEAKAKALWETAEVAAS